MFSKLFVHREVWLWLFELHNFFQCLSQTIKPYIVVLDGNVVETYLLLTVLTSHTHNITV